MNDRMAEHPLDTESPRLSVRKPELRHDMQGDASDAERLRRAMRSFAMDFGYTAAVHMDSCIHCGMCAEACHYYVTTGDPKYTPIWKVEPFKRAYKREAGPFAFFYSLFNLKPRVSVDQLKQWQELIYDSCTMCGRCTMICPMGIDVAALVGQARHAMFKAGLVPHELWAVAERAEREGSPLGARPDVFEERVEWMGDENDIEIRMNAEKADVLLTMSSIEIMKYPESIAASAKVMEHLGLSYTFSSDGYEATNFGMLSGNLEWQRDMSLKLINAALKCGAKYLLLPECGHAYSAMRWQGANLYGKPLPFKVRHISEFLARTAGSREAAPQERRKEVHHLSRSLPGGAAWRRNRGPAARAAGARRRAARDEAEPRNELVLRRWGRRDQHPSGGRSALQDLPAEDAAGRGNRRRDAGHDLRQLPAELR